MIEITCICETCKERKNIDDFDIRCDECINKHENDDLKESIKDSLKTCLDNDFEWKAQEYHVGFKNDEEKELFFKGSKYGYMAALFWISDYYGLVEYFEKLKDL